MSHHHHHEHHPHHVHRTQHPQLVHSHHDAPWAHYPQELPDSKAALGSFPELNLLFDEEFARSLHEEIRQNALAAARLALPKAAEGVNNTILLQGGTSALFELYDSDTDLTEFRQEAFFRYLFAINEPDCWGAINVQTGETLLFVPEISDDSQRWNGERRPLSYYTQRYGVSATFLTKDLISVLTERHCTQLYLLRGVNLDSGLHTKTVPTLPELLNAPFVVDYERLHPLLTELRVFKTEREIKLLRIGNDISSQAHTYVMRHIRAGMREIQLEALFKAYCNYFSGTRSMAYTCICGSGSNGSILHYGHAGRPNDRVLQANDTVVLDMGAEFLGYATDITRSYPVNGKFTADQAAVHNAVYAAQMAVMNAMKPGVWWPEMHRLAESVIVQHLIEMGVLHDGTVEEMMKAQVGSAFMPHGLGHMLGMNVHDVGGLTPGTSRSPEPGLCWLRCNRKLEAGMHLTVEPGLYFNQPTLEKAFANPEQARFINREVLKRFEGTGGCRLEDDVIVTSDGVVNLTTIAASVEEIEFVMSDKFPLHQAVKK